MLGNFRWISAPPIVVALVLAAGCREAPVPEAPSAPAEPSDTPTHLHALHLGAWEAYVQDDPELFFIEDPSRDLVALLQKEEELVVAVIGSVGAEEDLSYLEPFRTRLELLKANPPENVVVYGYYSPNYRTTKRAFAEAGRAGFYSVYDGGHYHNRYEAHASASLIRAIQNTVSNAGFGNLETTIDWLQGRYESWSRKTAQMASSGSQVYEKQANMEYLSHLRSYINNWIYLKNDILQAKAEADGPSREECLDEWNRFKATQIALLEHELKAANANSIEPLNEELYRVPTARGASAIVIGKFQLGSESVYLRLMPNRGNRPVRLTKIGI